MDKLRKYHLGVGNQTHVMTSCNVMKFNLHLGMATMRQAGIVMREFAWEFERYAQDVGIAEEDAKVYLVSALN